MTDLINIVEGIMRAFALVVLYVYVGFGPGFIVGILTANALFGRGAPTFVQSHKKAIQEATQHNAQWDPTHERWQKKK